MSTNYYLLENICPACGQEASSLHIGKSISGWCFALHSIPERGLNSLDDWKVSWTRSGVKIIDEYDYSYSPTEMELIIHVRVGVPRSVAFYEANHGKPGPFDLVRHKLNHGGCVGHGEGAWDYTVGNFQ